MMPAAGALRNGQPVIVFGGSFSPPTVAHEAIIGACLALLGFAAVWLMPSGDRRDKVMSAGDEDRLAMLDVIRGERFHADPRLIISDFELRLPRPSETYQTVAALGRAYPRVVFWFVLGADSYRSMATPAWEHGTTLRYSLNLILVGRDDVPIPARSGMRALQVSLPVGLSSTYVRERVRARQPLDGLVSGPVARFIQEHALYRS